ncbi:MULTISPECIES: protein kinase domain-containing protein [unclassified Frankia]|uniref:protein kinase domain-containing protein n=1 Tax=unclassified Frankia TaxID=2632575 RepID=UPI002024AB0B
MLIDRARVTAALPVYELGAELGAGNFGLVLAGRHRRLDREVAVKILAAAHEGAEAGFEAEARLLATMDHPHVVRVYDYIEHDGLCLIIMELLAGGTLTRRRGTGLSLEDSCAVGLAVAEALTCAHALGVLQRDVKLDNILFDANSLLKVTGFGIAKIFKGSAATASMVAGTPKYMAPEQIIGGRLEPATDIYALAVVLYELLTGAPPFDPKLPLHALYHQHLNVMPARPAGVCQTPWRMSSCAHWRRTRPSATPAPITSRPVSPTRPPPAFGQAGSPGPASSPVSVPRSARPPKARPYPRSQLCTYRYCYRATRHHWTHRFPCHCRPRRLPRLSLPTRRRSRPWPQVWRSHLHDHHNHPAGRRTRRPDPPHGAAAGRSRPCPGHSPHRPAANGDSRVAPGSPLSRCSSRRFPRPLPSWSPGPTAGPTAQSRATSYQPCLRVARRHSRRPARCPPS